MRTYPLLSLIVALLTVVSPSIQPVAAEEAPGSLPPNNIGGIPKALGAGTVAGVVRFKGARPEPKPLTDIAGSAFCKNCYKEGELPKQDTYVFGKNGDDDTLQNVLVYVSKGLEGKHFDPPEGPVVLDQVGCVYTPHVVAVMTGQTLEIRNSDETLHNAGDEGEPPLLHAPVDVGLRARAAQPVLRRDRPGRHVHDQGPAAGGIRTNRAARSLHVRADAGHGDLKGGRRRDGKGRLHVPPSGEEGIERAAGLSRP
jgi:hypothetical protein